jgi:hypothetical protein
MHLFGAVLLTIIFGGSAMVAGLPLMRFPSGLRPVSLPPGCH